MSVRCVLCTGTGELVCERPLSVTSESRVIPAPSSLYVCSSCGHLFSTIAIDLGRYYADQYDAVLSDDGMDEIVTTKDGSFVFRTELDFGLFAAQALSLVGRDARIFEYGCGRGRILSRLVKNGYQDLWAYDLGHRYREPVARLVGDERVFIGQRPSGPFDLACSFFVLEHDEDPMGSLRYLRGVVREGGRLFLMLPSYATNAVDLACADHLHHYSADLLRRMVEASGFTVESVDETSSLGAMTLLARNDGGAPRPLVPGPDAKARALASVSSFLELDRRVAALEHRVPDDRPLYLYGAGFYATMAHAALGGRPVAGVFDANPRKQGTERLGCRVSDPGRIAEGTYKDARLLVCVNGQVAPSIGERYRTGFADVVCL